MKCPHCNKETKLVEPMKICSICNGSGKVVDFGRGVIDALGSKYWKKCPSCNDNLIKSKPQLTEEELESYIIKSLDHIGLELRVWKEGYFGRKPEEELVKRFTQALLSKMRG